jgi:hypothetical protein
MVGDYSAVSGGFAAEGIEDLTGCVVRLAITRCFIDRFGLRGVATKLEISDILDTDQFWTEELMLANEDRLFGCSIKQDGADEEINGARYS